MKRRSYVVIGVTTLLVSIGGVALVALAGSERQGVTRAPSAVEGEAAAPVTPDDAVARAPQIDTTLFAGGKVAAKRSKKK